MAFFGDWTISLRNNFYKPMKFEYYLLQWKLFQMRPITVFYDKPFFRFKKKRYRHKKYSLYVKQGVAYIATTNEVALALSRLDIIGLLISKAYCLKLNW